MAELQGNLFIDGPAGKLEALLKEPGSEVSRAAIVCHPHPLFGGTMHNKVVYRIAKAFSSRDFAVLRFNFRGAGLSHGRHDDGRGEQDDLRAAMAFIRGRYAEARLWLSGFSFGSMVMMRVGCGDPTVAALVAAGFPATKYEMEPLRECRKPKLLVQGEMDQYGKVEDLTRVYSAIAGPKEMVVVPGADHFFEGHLDELAAAVTGFITRAST